MWILGILNTGGRIDLIGDIAFNRVKHFFPKDFIDFSINIKQVQHHIAHHK